MPVPSKRGYSREFTPIEKYGRHRYLLDDIPAQLWEKAQAKARKQGISMRALILELMSNWLKDR